MATQTKAPTAPKRRARPLKAQPDAGVQDSPQISQFDEVIDDADLQELIKAYLEDKKAAATVMKVRNEKYGRIKSAFPSEKSAGKTFRVGPYTVTPKSTKGGHREFDYRVHEHRGP